MKILLVWEMVPDEVRLYEFEEGSNEAKLAEASAGKYINGDELEEDDSIFQLNDILDGIGCTNEGLSRGGVVTGPYSKVIICGFFM